MSNNNIFSRRTILQAGAVATPILALGCNTTTMSISPNGDQLGFPHPRGVIYEPNRPYAATNLPNRVGWVDAMDRVYNYIFGIPFRNTTFTTTAMPVQ